MAMASFLFKGSIRSGYLFQVCLAFVAVSIHYIVPIHYTLAVQSKTSPKPVQILHAKSNSNMNLTKSD